MAVANNAYGRRVEVRAGSCFSSCSATINSAFHLSLNSLFSLTVSPTLLLFSLFFLDCLLVMFDFGDELTIQSYRIPWLIWIQLLVMVLFIVFLYCCSTIAFELSEDSASASPSVGVFTSARSDVDKPLRNSTTGTVTSSHHSKAGGSQSRRGARATSTSRRIVRGEDLLEREASSAKDLTHISLSETSYHPCYYIRLARQVFLKCLGLDSTSDDSSNPERRRDT